MKFCQYFYFLHFSSELYVVWYKRGPKNLIGWFGVSWKSVQWQSCITYRNKLISIRTFHVYCQTLAKFGKGDLYIMLLGYLLVLKIVTGKLQFSHGCKWNLCVYRQTAWHAESTECLHTMSQGSACAVWLRVCLNPNSFPQLTVHSGRRTILDLFLIVNVSMYIQMKTRFTTVKYHLSVT
jgi:hypothetical protein